MKCNNCNAEWNVDASRSASITVCPFCQAEIVRDKTNWQFFDSTKELLAFIASEYGSDALFARKYFSDHTSPMMPQGQKNLVKQAFECGAVKVLQGNVSSDQAHKEIAVKQAAQKLIDTYASAREAAERVVWEFTNALGWGLPEPQSAVQQPEQTTPTNPVAPPPSGSIGKLMTLGWQSADVGDWKDAGDYFTKAREADPTYSPAFLGLICVDLKCPQEGKLADVKDPGSITNHRYYKLATSDPDIRSRLDAYIQTIQARIAAEQKAAEEAARRKRVQDAFDNAVKIMNSAQNPEDYRKAITAFSNIDSNYQDINSQIKVKVDECERKISAIDARINREKAIEEAHRIGKSVVEESSNNSKTVDLTANVAHNSQNYDVEAKASNRHVSFSCGHAFLGLISGAILGVLVSVSVSFLSAVFSYTYYEFVYAFNLKSLLDSLLSTPTVMTSAVLSLLGFFFEGFNITRKRFSISSGGLGFVFGGLVGQIPTIAVLIVLSLFISLSEFTEIKVISVSIVVCASIGFAWEGNSSCRDIIKLPLAFVGAIAGGVVGGIVGLVGGTIAGLGLSVVTLFILTNVISVLLVPFVVVCALIGAGYGFVTVGSWSR